MGSTDAICAVAALFIAGMAWLRTRMHYPNGPQGRRSLSRAGAIYFAVLVLLLAAGWFAAPPLARHLALSTPVPSTLARVVWFLAMYYLFIPVHLLLKARGLRVFSSS
jgi:hypothetical protein